MRRRHVIVGTLFVLLLCAGLARSAHDAWLGRFAVDAAMEAQIRVLEAAAARLRSELEARAAVAAYPNPPPMRFDHAAWRSDALHAGRERVRRAPMDGRTPAVLRHEPFVRQLDRAW